MVEVPTREKGFKILKGNKNDWGERETPRKRVEGKDKRVARGHVSSCEFLFYNFDFRIISARVEM